MSTDRPDVAEQRLAADEARVSRRPKVSLGSSFRAFWAHPSPWMVMTVLVAGVTARALVGDWRWSDLWAPVVLVALFPVLEWLIHVFVLHWRPRRVAGVTVDTLLARKHREHHADPRDVPLVFIPWRALVWVIVGYHAIALLAFPRLGQALTFTVSVAVVGLAYEWTHYLIHSDYRPVSRAYKAVWRNHRLHHYRDEHYWFTVTTTNTADRLFGTYPDPASVPASATAKNLHGDS
ncbi:sterol desaturase family protein [Nocardioides sp. Root151]|uniref:sterol desaturase family protein n=1 Tax=Nocardioides sp. Root151 TaxID=1736475 RepID=UPI0007026E81|nr:sterol desaturase family protein [Nocardioides sp. Root151]KQZ67163.1 fatty acid hydroxylase [Nocardioides sp. Root151]